MKLKHYTNSGFEIRCDSIIAILREDQLPYVFPSFSGCTLWIDSMSNSKYFMELL